MKLTTDQIAPTPDVAKGMDSECLMGVAKVGDRLLILLDLEKMFWHEEFQELAEVVS